MSVVPRTLIFVHDTSHLMGQDPDPVMPIRRYTDWRIFWAGECNNMLKVGEDFEYNSAILRSVKIRHVVPVQVKREVAKHFDDNEKQASAKRARGFLAELTAKEGVESPDLQVFEPITPLDSILGPDSDVDRRLISLCLRLANEPQTLVFLATRDGGIELELATRRRAGECLMLYSKTSLNELINELGFRFGELSITTRN